MRASAAGVILGTQFGSHTQNRTMIESLVLTAGLVWLVNGLNSRPDDGQAARDLMLSILPTTNDPQQGNLMFFLRDGHDLAVPFCPNGAVFLRPFRVPPEAPCPRISGGQLPSNASLAFLLGRPPHEIMQMLQRPGFQIQHHHLRQPTRKGLTKPHLLQDVPVIAQFQGLQFNRLVAAVDAGDDLPPEARGLRDEADDADTPTWLSKLWYQFLSDILQKCGNSQRLQSSHCHLSRERRQSATPEMFESLNLAAIFQRVRWRRVGPQDWLTMFTFFWPPATHITRPDTQNYPTMKYYLAWKAQITRLQQAEANLLRNQLWNVFQTLQWLPDATADRVWYYDDTGAHHGVFPAGLAGPAPRIVIQGIFAPTWVPELRHNQDENIEDDNGGPVERPWPGRAPNRNMVDWRVAMREESEESSD
jgi:hypothetical protein